MRVQREVILPVGVDQAWAHCSPIGALLKLFGDLVHLEDSSPAAAVETGLQVRLVWQLGASASGGKVEVVSCSPGQEIEWVSVTGIHHRVRVSFRELGPASTRLTVRASYASRGPLGWLAAAVVAPRIRGALDRGLAALRYRTEQPTS